MEKCLICGNQDINVISAVVSGFLLERIWDNSIEKETSICHCRRCGFAFYTLRPDEMEMKKLYCNYRDAFYQKQRQKYDSWYSKEINALFDDPDIRRSREDDCNDFLSKHIDVDKIGSVLDYGGNTGVHIPGFLAHADRFVFDISGVETIDGVRGFSDFDAVSERRYDFVMCLNMLEHVTDPKEIVEKITELVAKDGYIYIEVPFDSPFYKHKPGKLQFLFNKHFSMKVILDRFRLGLKFPYVMSEHINYFTEDSLRRLVGDVDVLSCETRVRKDSLGKSECICMLIRT